VQRTPRPAARLLLAGRFIASRASLVARPDGPVAGIDLATGRLVQLSFGQGGEDADALAARIASAGDLRAIGELGRHLGRTLISYEQAPHAHTTAGVAAAADQRPPHRGRRTISAYAPRAARARIAAVLTCGVLSALLVSSLTGGSRDGGVARAAPLPVAPAALASAPPARARTLHVPAPRPAARSRGGAAQVLLRPVSRRPPPRAVAPPLPRVDVERHREPGWVEGLFVGSS
jgi:hypothetical protein